MLGVLAVDGDASLRCEADSSLRPWRLVAESVVGSTALRPRQGGGGSSVTSDAAVVSLPARRSGCSA